MRLYIDTTQLASSKSYISKARKKQLGEGVSNTKMAISFSYSYVILILGLLMVGSVGGAEDLEKECTDNFQKLTSCLGYATGKGGSPTKECCTSVSSIKDDKPVCLCYIIQQIHTGANPQFKSLGIQESKLLQLPSACNLANASSSDCPKLLGLPANSPDAAIFNDTSSSSTATPGAPKGTSTTAAPDTANTKSAGNSLHAAVPQLIAGTVLSIFTAAVFVFYV